MGNRISRFIRFYFQEQHLGYFSLFGPLLTHPELESYIVPFFWVPYFVRNVLTKFDIFLSIGLMSWEIELASSSGFIYLFRDNMILL